MGSSGLAYTCFFVIDKIQFSPNYKFVEYFLLSNESIHSFSLLHFAYSSRQELSTILFKSLMFIKCIPCSSEILTIRRYRHYINEGSIPFVVCTAYYAVFIFIFF
uniref:Uncharacterized protein n=1 Tax=Cacopsylla melanoneura TaxID=428564 RepID=A0A8D8X648_9HEMI